MTVSEAEFQDLVARLVDPDESARKQAVFRLAKSGDLRAIDHLKRVGSQDPSQEVRYLCRKGLQFMATQQPSAAQQVRPVSTDESLTGAPADILTRRLASPDPAHRIAGLKAIVKSGQSDLLPEVVKMVGIETHSDVRSLLPVVIGKLGSRAHVPSLAKLLEDKDPRVRSNTIEALENVKEISSYALIVRSLQDEDHRVIVTAVKALSTLGKLNLLQVCEQMLKTSQYWMRDSATFCLAQSRFAEALPVLERCLEDEHESVRQKARLGIEKLAQQGSPEAARVLDRLGAPGPPLPPADEFDALEELSRSFEIRRVVPPPPLLANDDSALQPLLEKLKGERDAAEIVKSLRGLAAVKNPVVAPIVKDFLQHPELRVRRCAREVLETFGIEVPDEAPAEAPAKPAAKPARPAAKAAERSTEKPALPARVTGSRPSVERPALAPPLSGLVKVLLFMGLMLEILGAWPVGIPIAFWTWRDAKLRLTDRIKVRWLFRIPPLLWGILAGPLAPLFLTLYLMLRHEYSRIASRGRMIGDRYEDTLDLFAAMKTASIDFWAGFSSRGRERQVASADLDDLPFDDSRVDVPVVEDPSDET